MSYRVAVEFAPAYELVVSLVTFVAKRRPRTLELGADWAAAAGQGLDLSVFGPIAELDMLGALLPVVRSCAERGDAQAFVAWFGALSPSAFQDLIASGMPPEKRGSHDFRPLHAPLLRALTAWHEHYFRQLDPALLAGLAADAEAMRGLSETTAPTQLVELATGGVEVAPTPDLQLVVLIPQHHFRPINLYLHLQGLSLYAYPADVLPPEPGAPPLALTRLTGALADTSRLKILRLLASDAFTFTEVQKEMGLAKSTVHHHLVTLRAAGLIRVHDLRADGAKYSLRPAALDLIGARLGAYLKERG